MRAGQAQKEGFVNEAMTRIDALLHGTVLGTATTPPTAPAEGDCWLIASGADGAWSGRADQIAAWTAGAWSYFAPRTGMRMFNLGAQQDMRHDSDWKVAIRPAAPSGGTTIDSQARTAIAALIACLVDAGVLPPA